MDINDERQDWQESLQNSENKQLEKEHYKYESRAENSIALELQIGGMYRDYERQHSISKYFADFYFPSINVVLEVDGAEFHSSPESINHDKIRDKFMNERGFTVIRISGSLALKNPSGVLNVLRMFPKCRTFFMTSDQDIAFVQQLALEQYLTK